MNPSYEETFDPIYDDNSWDPDVSPREDVLDMDTTDNATHVDVQTQPCLFCGKSGTIRASIEGLGLWKTGTFIQDALPELSAGDREQLMTGTHGECFDKAFGGDE